MDHNRVHRLRLALLVGPGVAVLMSACSAVSSTAPLSTASGTLSPAPSVAPSAPSATPVPPVAPAPVATESNPPGDIPDNQAFVSYAPAGAGFSVKVPEGWARTGTGTHVFFTDKLNSVTISSDAATDPLTSAWVSRTIVPALRSSVPKFQLLGVAAVSRPAGAGVLVTYLADSATDPVTGKVVRDSVERYVFEHGGHLVTLTLAGPKGADNVDPWRKVTDSLVWTP